MHLLCANKLETSTLSQFEKKEWDETVVNKCDKCIFFWDTLSKGKKYNHAFHNACLMYLIQFYDNKCERIDKPTIEYNAIHTDNCMKAKTVERNEKLQKSIYWASEILEPYW